MILWRHWVQISILIPVPKTFSPSTVNVRSKFWRFWKKREIFQKFDCLFDLMRRKLHFSILLSLSENFLAKHGKSSFKVLKSLKKNRTFKKSVFNSKFSFGHVECSFKKQVKIFPPSFKKSFSSSYVTSNTNTSKRIHKDT